MSGIVGEMHDSPVERIAEGREAEIFAWGPGSVLKLYRSRDDRERAEWEDEATSAVSAVGGPAPRPLGLTTVEGRPGLLLERVDGPDLLTAMGRRPWTVRSAGAVMGRVHAAVHAIAAPSSLPTTRRLLERRVRVADAYPAWRDAGLRAIERLPDGNRLCHNDLHPQNVLLTASGAVVIDWAAATSGDPAADVARSIVIMTVGAPPASAPRRIRLIAPFVTRAFRSRYLTAYRSDRALDDERMRGWLLPQAIARIVEEIPGERPRLDLLVQRLLAGR